MKKAVFCLLILWANAVIAQSRFYEEAVRTLREQIMEEAAWALEQKPLTITAYPSPRSAGGLHDFSSEGD